MEDGIVVPQIDATHGNTSNAQAPAVAALTGDTAADFAAIAKEMGVALDPAGNVAQPAQQNQPRAQPTVTPPPVPVQAAPAPIEVPPKFQNPDGTLNEAKLDKSTKSLEERVAHFKSLEREHSQRQNQVNNPQPAAPQFQPAPLPQNGLQLSEFERQAALDILADAKALGIQMTDQQAILQARADIRMADAKYQAEQGSVKELHREVKEQRMTAELSALLSADETLDTPETAKRVIELKELMGFKTYREAYAMHLGEVEIAQRTRQVLTPTPTGPTAKAPPTPVGPVSRVLPTVNLDNPKALSDADLLAAVRAHHPRFRNL